MNEENTRNPQANDREEVLKEIEILRQEIDLINHNLLDVLNLRQLKVIKIIRLKQSQGLPLRDSEREEQMLNKVIAGNSGPITAETVRDVMKAVFKHTLQDLNI